MTIRPLALIGAILATSTAASAAEGELKDLRLVGTLSVHSDASLKAGSLLDEEIEDQQTWTVALQHVRSLGAPGPAGVGIFGGELFYARGEGEIENAGSKLDVESTTWGLTGMLGWAYFVPAQPVHAELAAYGSIGKTDTVLYTYSGSAQALKGDDAMEEVGLRAATYWTMASKHQIGLEVRYAFVSRTNPVVSSGGSAARLDIDSANLSVGLGAGFRY